MHDGGHMLLGILVYFDDFTQRAMYLIDYGKPFQIGKPEIVGMALRTFIVRQVNPLPYQWLCDVDMVYILKKQIGGTVGQHINAFYEVRHQLTVKLQEQDVQLEVIIVVKIEEQLYFAF